MTNQISEPLMPRLLELPQQVMLDVMLEALDLMQAYNGRSITYCICDAMGGTLRDDKWTVPSVADVCAKYNYEAVA